MEMPNLASKLKSLKLEPGEDLSLHLVLISLPVHFGQFKSLNELISHYVQEEERLQKDKTESTHFASTLQNKKRKNIKGVMEWSSQQKKPKKDEEFTYYFYKKSGHMKK
ncbi:hypothetical protein CR513_07485, partial [Mucuna pruriens]